MGIETLAASTLFKVGTGIATAASIVNGVGQFAAAQSEARRLREQAAAQDAATAANEQRLRRQTRMALGRQRNQQAGSGITLTGSALDVALDDAREAELNTLLARYEGEARSRALRDQARSVRTGGFVSLGGSLLGAGASYLGGASAYQQLFGSGAAQSGLSQAASNFARQSAFIL